MCSYAEYKYPESPNLAVCQLYHGISLLLLDFAFHLMINQGPPQQSTRCHSFTRGTVSLFKVSNTPYIAHLKHRT